MRLRNKPWAKPLIDANPQYVVTEPEKFAGKWQERFEKEQPIFVEVGTGKGRFIVEMAEKYPDRNFIGLEMQTVAVGIALKKQLDAKLPNLQLVCANGLNFSMKVRFPEFILIFPILGQKNAMRNGV